MSDFHAKCTKFSAFPDSLAGFNGPTSKGGDLKGWFTPLMLEILKNTLAGRIVNTATACKIVEETDTGAGLEITVIVRR